MSFVQKSVKKVMKAVQCGCSQIQFGTTPPVTMMARIVSEGGRFQLATKKENSLMNTESVLKNLAVVVENPSDLVEISEELKELKIVVKDQTDVIELKDVIHPSALMNVPDKESEELIEYVTKPVGDIAVRDDTKHVDIMKV